MFSSNLSIVTITSENLAPPKRKTDGFSGFATIFESVVNSFSKSLPAAEGRTTVGGYQLLKGIPLQFSSQFHHQIFLHYQA